MLFRGDAPPDPPGGPLWGVVLAVGLLGVLAVGLLGVLAVGLLLGWLGFLLSVLVALGKGG